MIQATTPVPSTTEPGDEFTESDLTVLKTAIPERAKELSQDTIAFWKELPRLLANGQEGRFVLLHAGNIISLWDTLGGATQAGYDQFGADGRFTTVCIKRFELQRLKQFLAQQRAMPCQL